MILKHLSGIKKAVGAPSADFNGIWSNELGSEMHLNVRADGVVTGKYKTGVGEPQPIEEFDLSGFASGDLLSFTVNFGRYNSLASWAGQHTINAGKELIKTMWLLARNVQDSDEAADLWGAVLTGCNDFQRPDSRHG